MVITIAKEVEFDAGHRVPGHASKCKNPHGHRYRVRVTCQGFIVTEKGAPDEGMLVDFGDLKALMTHRIHDPLDHGFIVHADDLHMRQAFLVAGQLWKVIVFPTVPTAENIARWVWDQLEEPISERFRDGLVLHRVEVWETPTSVATVERGTEPRPPVLVTLNPKLSTWAVLRHLVANLRGKS
jgi:6-pyruvoyltetrahydropterin/6-carboxytetrahydropterin synthase